MRAIALLCLLGLLAYADDVLACSCSGETLEVSYERYSNVFTAFIVAAEYDDSGNIRASFEITELFKGDVPFQHLVAPQSGSSCSAQITVGTEYLVITNDDGQFWVCSPVVPLDWATGLDLLRAFKAGETPDLSSPWRFDSEDGACSLKTSFPLPDGRWRYLVPLHLSLAGPHPENEDSQEIVEEGRRQLLVNVYLREGPGSELGLQHVIIRSETRTFLATLMEEQERQRTRRFFGIEGSEAMRFVDALASSRRIVVDGIYTRDGVLNDVEIRRTNAGDAIERFSECITQ